MPRGRTQPARFIELDAGSVFGAGVTLIIDVILDAGVVDRASRDFGGM
jgi:hypothetical protein